MTQVRKHRPLTPRQASRLSGPLDRELDAAVFKALGDPTRLALFACIAKCGRGCGVGEVAACCAVDLSVVSRHLAQLARAGLLEAVRSGRSVTYRVRYADVGLRLRRLADALEGCCSDGSCGPGGCCG